MKYINFSDLRIKIKMEFESYFLFSLFELNDCGVKAGYELMPSRCTFSVNFKKEYFVWVEKFFEHLTKSFEEMEIKGWSDFKQLDDYDVENYVTYTLFCKKTKMIDSKYFSDKKDVYFCDIFKRNS